MMYKDRRKAKKSKAFNALLRQWSEVRILHGSFVQIPTALLRNYGAGRFFLRRNSGFLVNFALYAIGAYYRKVIMRCYCSCAGCSTDE